MDPLSPRDEDQLEISPPLAAEPSPSHSNELKRPKINGKPFAQPARLRAFARFDSGSEPSTGEASSPANGKPTTEELDASSETKPEPMWMEMEAGPSDYWRRSPSISDSQLSPPPPAWRQASNEAWPEDIEDGPSDVWTARELGAPSGSDRVEPDGRNGYTTPSRSFQNTPAGTPGVNDEIEYEARMRSILQPPSLANGHSEGTSLPPGGVKEEKLKALGPDDFADDQSDELIPLQRDDRSLARSTSTVSSSVGAERLLNRPSPFKRSSTPYLHPSISRLRSHMRTTSTATEASSPARPSTLAHNRLSSHFSQLSLAKSDSTTASPHLDVPSRPGPRPDQSPAFAFHPLRKLSRHLFSSDRPESRPTVPRKASSLLGIPSGQAGEMTSFGKATVMDVRDIVAVGTESGLALVYGFDQKLQHILQNDPTASSGSVTAITISPDNTFVAVGHATGNIHLYELSRPAKPARTTVALSLDQVLSGQKEGHLQGSRILHIGFVGARHTSIVSGDEHGRAFWWSLGKVIGVESNDVVRMLGSYPGREPPQPAANASGPGKKSTTLYAVAPLPIGTHPNPSDEFSFTALQTPTKLVIVGMKPTARTWYRKMRNDTGGEFGGLRGCTQWSIETGDGDRTLAYSWGNTLRLLRIKVPPVPATTKPAKPPPPDFLEGLTFEASGAILALQWYNANHIVLVTPDSIVLLDTRDMRPVETSPLQSDSLTPSFTPVQRPQPLPESVSSSVRAHRGKVFILTRTDVQVASLLHWNDRILARVHQGDFLEAIQVALAYYEDRPPGNTINLPQDRAERRQVVGTRVKELLRSSLEWAFSEDRMRDDTHYSVDGRGVDLTGLFEGLAASCIDASLALGDTTFLFEDEYEYFANAGIQNIFLNLLQPYIFDGRIRQVPPTIVQALISMHEGQDDLDSAEAIIWHVDPMALDINQVVRLCEAHGLWDALIHVYTRTMRDYVAPLVKLVGVIIGFMRDRSKRSSMYGDGFEDEDETLASDAYKLFAYLEMVLSGQSYPSGEALPGPGGVAARSSVYSFLFANQLVQWPEGNDGTLVPALDNSTPYPYLDLILQFDVEAFLHAMDLAFEDSYLNDASISRQSIVNILLGVMHLDRFTSDDVTILHIFVARNLPKYPQFLSLPSSTLHHILTNLASAEDGATLEDHQLATEFLLSAYTPPDISKACEMFEQAGFYRILRSIYLQERRWRQLILAHVDDQDLDSDLFGALDALLPELRLDKNGKREVERAIESVLPRLLDLSVRQTAVFLDKHFPILHNRALETITVDLKKLAYLRVLLDPSADDAESSLPLSTSIDSAARLLYVSLLTVYDSSSVIAFLDGRGPQAFDLPALADQFRKTDFTEGILWALDRQGNPKAAFDVTESVFQARSADLGQALMDGEIGDAHLILVNLTSTCHMAVRLCQEHSKGKTAGADNMWFTVLHGIMESVHSVGIIAQNANDGADVMDTLRSLVQYTLQSLVSSSSSTLSFPRLFKRLIDESTMVSGKAKGRAYSEFRTILTGMLDSYRSEGEMLSMTTRMVEEDLFLSVKEVTKRRQMGWRPAVGTCGVCRKVLEGVEGEGLVVLASGQVRHKQCKL